MSSFSLSDYKLFGPSGSTCINGNWKPSVKLVQCIKGTNININLTFNLTINTVFENIK